MPNVLLGTISLGIFCFLLAVILNSTENPFATTSFSNDDDNEHHDDNDE